MNTIIVKSVPEGVFEKISIEMADWKQKFQSLINQRKRIKYSVYDMPTIGTEIQNELGKQSYVKLVLESDHDQYFLIPTSN